MKKNTQFLRTLAFLTLFAMLALLAACGDSTTTTPAGTEAPGTLSSLWDTATYREDATVGTGATEVTLKVTADGATVTLTLLTDEATLADALLAAELCRGETSQYGLYISHVNGIRADYTLDNGFWWNLVVNEEASMTGASDVAIRAGDVYEFVRTR